MKKRKVLAVLISFTALIIFLATGILPNPFLSPSQDDPYKSSEVLGETTKSNKLFGIITFNIPAIFTDKVTIKSNLLVTKAATFTEDVTIKNKNLTLGSGKLTASNVVYGLTAGENITISGSSQNPVISADAPASVTSLQGKQGELKLSQGTGITIDGLAITNSDPGTAQKIFKTITIDGTAISAGSNADTFTIAQGSGITLTPDSGSKTVTISSSLASSSNSWTASGSDIYFNTGKVGIGTTTPASTLDVTGTAGITGAVTLSSISTGILHANASGLLSSSAVNLAGGASEVTGTLPLSSGGTGVTTSPTNGQLLIGNGSGYTVAALTGTNNQITIANSSGGITLSLPQNINTTATPTFSSLNLAANTSQVVFGTGTTGMITMDPLTSARTYTFPDASGTVCLTIGNCAGSGGSIIGSGTANRVVKFTSSSSVSDSSIYDNGKVGIGTTNPVGLLDIEGAPAGQALTVLNNTGTDQSILTASSSGTTRFTIANDGTITATKYAAGVAHFNGSGIISSGVVTNSDLQNSSLTITAGTGLSGGGGVSLGGSVTLNNAGVLSLIGGTSGSAISGALTIANAASVGSTITIDNASTVAKGIASFNSSNFSVSSGAVSVATNGVGPTELAATSVGAGTYGSVNNGASQFTVDADGRLTAASSRALDLSTADVTGVLPIAQGGTNNSNAYTTGSIIFSDGTKLTEDNAFLSYSNISKKLGLGTAAPIGKLTVNGLTSGKALVVLNETGNQDIMTASASGITEFTVQRNGTLQFAGGSGFLNTLSSAATGAQTINIPSLSGSDTICFRTLANCLGSGSGAIGGSGTLNRLAKFTPDGSNIGNASINDLYASGVAMTIDANGNLGVGTPNPTALLTVNGGNTGGNAVEIVNQIGAATNDIFAASASGTTKFRIANNGNLSFTGGTNFTNTLTSLATANQTITLPNLAGTDTVCFLTLANCVGTGGGLTGSGTTGQIAFFNGAGNITSEASGFAWDAVNNKLGIGNDSPIGKFDLNGAVTGKALAILNETGNQDIFTASASGATRLTLSNSGNLNLTGGAYTSNGVSGITQGSASCVTTTNGIVTGFGVCQLGSEQWIVNNGSIYTGNTSLDLLIGGTSTASAKFAVLNISGGTPSASVSAGTTDNATFLTGAGNLGTTNAQTLTLGSISTGNVVLAPGGTTALTALANGNLVGTGTLTGLTGLTSSGTINFSALTANRALFTDASSNLATAGNSTALSNALTDETGTGVAVFGTSPTLTTSLLTGSSSFDLINTSASTLNIGGAATTLNLGATTGTATIANAIVNLSNGVLQTGGTQRLSNTGALGNITGYTQTSGVFSTTLTTTNTALFSSSTANSDSLALAPNTTGANAFIGTLTTADLTGNQTYTLPNATGTICISGQTCASSGTLGYWTRTGTNLSPSTATDTLSLGTTSPFATLDVRGNSGTTPVASFSGQTAFASMVIDNTGTGDLFTASKAGATKFTINNSGQLTISDGSVTAPSINFSSQTNTGLSYASNAILFSRAGGQVASFGTSILTSVTLLGGTSTSYQINPGSATNAPIYTFRQNTTTGMGAGANSSELALFTNNINRFLIDANGNVGVGTQTPLAGLDVRARTATTPAASFSGSTTNASLITDNSGTGDLFTASKSGASKFTVLNSGDVQINNLTQNGGLLYANGTGTLAQTSVGSTGQCLTSSGGGAPTWTTCAAGSNLWQTNSGTVSPFSNTMDLLVGGTSTASAKFGFINNAAGTPTATISGNFALAVPTGADPAIGFNAYNGGSLVFKTSPGGDSGLTTRMTIANNGFVTFPGGQTIHPNGLYYGNGVANSSTTNNALVQTATTGTTISRNIADANPVLIVQNQHASSTGDILQLKNSASTLGVFTQTGRLGIGTTNPLATLDVRGSSGITPTASISASSSFAAAVVDQTGTGDLFTASTSGMTRFTLNNSGDIAITNALAADTVFSSRLSGEANSRFRIGAAGLMEWGIGSSAPDSSIQRAGVGLLQTSALRVNGNPGITAALGVLSTSANSITALIKGASGQTADLFQMLDNSNTVLSKFDRNGALTIANTLGTSPAASISSTTSFPALSVDNSGTGDLFTASKSGATKFVINNAGNVQINNLTTNGGVLYTNGTGTVAQTGAGTSSQCLFGGTTPTWSACAAGTNLWQENLGALSPANITDDLLLGATATTSAKFAFLNNAGGIPVASISANSGNNALYITGDGTLATTNRGNLTIGNSAGYDTTGNLLINPNGNGFVGIGTSSPTTPLFVQRATSGSVLTLSNSVGSAGARTALEFKYNSTSNLADIAGTQELGGGGGLAFRTATTSNGGYNTRLYINKTGDVAIGTGNSTPLATLDIRGNTATTPFASISGSTNFAGLVVDQSGSGDLFTASNSGATKFVIDNGGNVGIGIAIPLAPLHINVAGSSNGLMLSTTGTTIGNGLALEFKSNSGATGLSRVIGQVASGGGGSLALQTTTAVSGYINRLYIKSTGEVAIGGANVTPLAQLDLRAGSGIITAASISGQTAQGVMVIDQSGVGDLFTASKSGATKFVINNNGNIQFAGTSNFLNTIATAATAARTYTLPDETGTLCIQGSTNCGFALGSNYWQLNSGALSPFSNTADLLLGGTSTASAKFAFLNNVGGTPVASISAGTANNDTYLTGDGNLATTNKQTLTIGGTTTGNINIMNTSGASFATFDTVNSRLGIGMTPGAGYSLSVNGNILASTSNIDASSFTSSTSGTGFIKNYLAGTGGVALNDVVIQADDGGTNKILTTTTARDIRVAGVAKAAAASGGVVGVILSGTATVNVDTAAVAIGDQLVTSTSVGKATVDNNATTGILGIAQTTKAGGSNGTVSVTVRSVSGQYNPIFRGTIDSANAFRIQNAAGAQLFNVGSIGTSSSASVSGNTSFAALVVDNSGTGDIFTASKSGATKFVIDNSGNVGIGTNLPTTKFQISDVAAGGHTIMQVLAGATQRYFLDDRGGAKWTVADGGDVERGSIAFGTPSSSPGMTFRDASGTSRSDFRLLTGGGFTFGSVSTGGTPTEQLRLNVNGLLGFGNTVPVAKLDIAGAITGKALTIFNETGDQDIFAASKSGLTKFVIKNNGDVQINSLTTNGGVLYTNGTGTVAQTGAGTSSQCLFGGTTPTWSACAAGTNLWQENLGALSPANITDDLLLGATATTSAKFGFLNVAGGTPVASISANSGNGAAYLTGDGKLATTALQTLTLGDSTTTGNVVINPSGRILMKGYTGSSTNGILGNFGVTGSVEIVALNNGGAFRVGDSTGVPLFQIDTNNNIVSLVGDVAGSGSQLKNSPTLNLTARYWNGSASTLSAFNIQNIVSSTAPNTRLAFTNNASAEILSLLDTGSLGLGTISPLATLDIRGNSATTPVASLSGSTNFAAAVVDQSGTGDILTASKSGATKFSILNNGNLSFAGATNFLTTLTSGATLARTINLPSSGASDTICLLTLGNCSGGATQNYWQMTAGTVSPFSNTLDLLIGGIATTSAQFAVTGVNTATPVASISAVNNGGNGNGLALDASTSTIQSLKKNTLVLGGSSTGDIQFKPNNASTSLYLASNGNVGIGTTTPGQGLVVSSTTGVQLYAPNSYNGATSDSNWLRSPKNSISAFIGDNDNVTSYASTDSAGDIRFNGAGWAWGDFSYHPKGYGAGNNGQFIFSTTSSNLDSTPNAKVGIGDLYVNGSAGIGTNSPLSALDVRGNSGITPFASISGQSSFAGLVVDNTGTGDLFTASKSGATKFVITNAGNVGIGVANPTKRLAIAGDGTGQILAGSGGIGSNYSALSLNGTLNGTDYNFVSSPTDKNLYINVPSTQNIYFGVAATAHSTFDSSGRLGIGTLTPLARLDVRGNTGTTPTASISATSSFAALVVDQSGTGELITASAAGRTQFTVDKSGLITTASVGTGSLKTATGSTTCGSNTDCNVTANDYGFFPSFTDTSINKQSHSIAAQENVSDPGNTTARWQFCGANAGCAVFGSNNNGTATARWRYITASDHPTIWAVVNADGTMTASVWEAEDPIEQTEYPKNPNALEGTPLKSGQYFLSPEPLTVTNLKTFYGKLPASDSTAIMNNLKNYIVDTRHWLDSFNSLDDINRISERYQPAAREWAFRYVASQYKQSPAMGIMLFLKVENGILVPVDDPYGTFQTYNQNLIAAQAQAASDPNRQRGADIAEWYHQQGTDIKPGDVVTMAATSSATFVTKSQTAYDPKALGIISTNPGQVLGQNQNDSDVQLALTGRVPVNVSTQNGPIHQGDMLTTSTIPGVAMKATKAGQVIGKALESYDNQNPTAVGQIMVYANLSWYDPDVYLTDTGNINIFNDTPGIGNTADMLSTNANTVFGVKDSNGQEIKRIGVFSDGVIGNLKTGNIEAQKLILAGQNVNDRLNNLENASSGSAQLANKVDDINAKLQSLTTKVATLEANLAFYASGSALLNNNPSNFAASSSAQLGLDQLDVKDATVSGTLSVLSRTLLSDVGITGKVNIGLLNINGLDPNAGSGQYAAATINTSAGPLMLQSDGFNGVDFLNGKVTIDIKGNIKTDGEITAKKINIQNTDVASASLGETLLKADETKVIVKTTALTNQSKIFVQAEEIPVTTAVKRIGKDTFEIKTLQPQNSDVKLQWWIVN